MKKPRKITKKGWAAIAAAALVVAIALTGTLAWRNMSQQVVNELREEKNPGGRIHDDFNGLENKDVYAENFTDNGTGAPVYVRIRLEEYMEIGEEAGINRDDEDRKATPVLDGAKINDTSTWHIHIPGESAEEDPFHDYWTWAAGGETVYMPTFNKNKDSITPDGNGTYGVYDRATHDYKAGTPYSDYVEYTDDPDDTEKVYEKTANAYYDADPNEIDEYTDDENPDKVPGGGGTEWSEDNPTGNYTKAEETHHGQPTLNSLGIISMEDWKTAGMPICNKWVYDVDGWFYWPEPVLPQTATGLLLDKVIQAQAASGKSYYAINVVGQFADKGSWGTPNTAADEQPSTATGFYVDGITGDAIALLNKASSVIVAKNGKWYLNQGQNIYREVADDTGALGDCVCLGRDREMGTGDDRTDVEYVEDGISLGTEPDITNYGNYFLRPTETEDYYRAVGVDGLLGTSDDDRLWVKDGGVFPTDLTATVVTDVTINQPSGSTLVMDGTAVEIEAGGDSLTFTADVLNGEEAERSGVTWSVEAEDKSPLAENTKISDAGVLTVDENETDTLKMLVVTAKSKKDDRQKNTYSVQVYGKTALVLTADDGSTPATVQAGKSIQLSAKMSRGRIAMSDDQQPVAGEISWLATNTPAEPAPIALFAVNADVDAVQISNDGLLTVGRSITGTVTVTAQYTMNGKPYEDTLTFAVTEKDDVGVTIKEANDKTRIGVGQTLSFTAILDHTDELETSEVTWTAGLSSNNGVTVTSVDGVSIHPSAEPGDTSYILSVTSDYSIAENGETLYVKAVPKDSSATTYYGTYKVTIAHITSLAVEVNESEGEIKASRSIVAPGGTLNLVAKATDEDGNSYYTQDVTWALAPKEDTVTLKDGTGISDTGVVRAGAAEPANETVVLTATATSKVDTSVIDTLDVTVSDGGFYIDGVAFLLLKEDTENHKALILTKGLIDKQQFDDQNRFWENNPLIRQNLIKWLEEHSTLNSAAILTTIYNIQNDCENIVSSNDKIFLLSAMDWVGWHVNAKVELVVNKECFTAGGVMHWKEGSWGVPGDNTLWWMRTPHIPYGHQIAVSPDGTFGQVTFARNEVKGVRPALWIDTDMIPVPNGVTPSVTITPAT